MKNFTKTLVAATIALGSVSANASILTSTTDMSGEAWMSVYDSTSKQTFTLDLGVAGVTAGSLYNQRAATGTLVNVDLTQFSDWTAFKSTADLTTTKFLVAATGQGTDFTPKIMITGSDATKFVGNSFAALGSLATRINEHVLNVNTDSANFGVPSANDTTLVGDADTNHIGQHNEGAGSNLLWGGAAFNPNGGLNKKVDFQLATIDLATFSGTQDKFTAQWELSGNNLTLSAVPVPAAVWMFGSALLGLAGVSRKRKAV